MMLALFDLSNLVIRHAFNPYNDLTDSEGRDVSGASGATRQIVRILQETGATEAVVAGDDSRSNLKRTALSDGYKAGRPASDDTIRHQFKVAREVLDELGLPIVKVSTHEADDVIASAAARATTDVRIITGDKDMLALCTDTVKVILLRPGKTVLCGPDEVREIVGVMPDRVQDYKALAGDKSDGIPGVAGIGHKRALQLLEKFDTIENLLAQPLPLDGISPAISNKLAEGAASCALSYKLAGLERGLDIAPYPVPEISFDLVESLFDKRGASRTQLVIEQL